MRLTIAVLGLLSVLGGCAGITSPQNACINRQGYCFDATINGRPVIPLQSRDLLARYRAVSHYAGDAAWQLAGLIGGEIEVGAAANERGWDWLGPRATVEVGVVPLGEQNLASTPTLSKREDVWIDGNAAVSVKQVLDKNVLPPGQYLFRIKASGDNWDRKTVLVTVE